MKRFKFIFILILVCSIFNCNTFINNKESFNVYNNIEYFKLKKFYKWMNKDVYNIIKKNSKEYKVDIVYICSVIQYESGDYCDNNLNEMYKVHSSSYAIGIMQILPCHVLGWKDYIYIVKKDKMNRPFYFKGKKWNNKIEVFKKYCDPVLQNPEVNISKGVEYLSKCLERAKKQKKWYTQLAKAKYNKYKETGNKEYYYAYLWLNRIIVKKEAARMYNSGINAKRWRYRNWGYPNRISKKYNYVIAQL